MLNDEELMFLNCGVGGDRKSVLNIHWKDWCWSWNSNTLATWCKELTHWKIPWCWERLKAGGEGDNKGWDGWMASPTQWTWVWVNSRSWWRTGRPGMLQSMGSQRVGHDWVTELNWTELYYNPFFYLVASHVSVLWERSGTWGSGRQTLVNPGRPLVQGLRLQQRADSPS